jgi:alkylation response protein AidB-like acyl-CoA dehydrogenase
VDLEFDTEQNDLREAVRDLLERAYGDLGRRRAVVAQEPGFSEKTWAQLAGMDLLGLPFAEEHGGGGAGPVEVAIVAEEIGRVLAPEPFVQAVVLAGGLIDAAGTDEQRGELLAGIADATLVPAFAHAEPGTRWSDTAAAVTATWDGETWRLTGTKEPVPTGGRADVLVVSAASAVSAVSPVTGGATRLFVVRGDADGLTRTGYRCHDGTRGARVQLADTPAEPLGHEADHTAAIGCALARARIAYAHEAVGAMTTALTTTTEYLTTRRQFGVSLNRFQALTFRAADMYVSLELARSVALWATLVIDSGGDVVTAAHRARLQTSRASRHIGEEAIQLHGGIGMTAEYPIGHYTSRLTAIDHILGDGDFALARLAADLDGHRTVDPLGAPYTG